MKKKHHKTNDIHSYKVESHFLPCWHLLFCSAEFENLKKKYKIYHKSKIFDNIKNETIFLLDVKSK